MMISSHPLHIKIATKKFFIALSNDNNTRMHGQRTGTLSKIDFNDSRKPVIVKSESVTLMHKSLVLNSRKCT